MNIIIIIQARVNSSRLPGKILLPLANKPLLLRMFERVKGSEFCKNVIIATSYENIDNPIADLCELNNVECFRGHPTDLLDRYYKAGLQNNADVVVKIPSDCPLIDPTIIDKVLRYYINNKTLFDFVSNLHPPSYPDGNDVEVIPMNILKIAHTEATKNFEREHTTPFIWENVNRFRIGNVIWENNLDYSMTHRWTIDYIEDYYFIKEIYNQLYYKNNLFSLKDILNLIKKNPSLYEINKKHLGVNWYRNHINELKTITPNQTVITNTQI